MKLIHATIYLFLFLTYYVASGNSDFKPLINSEFSQVRNGVLPFSESYCRVLGPRGGEYGEVGLFVGYAPGYDHAYIICRSTSLNLEYIIPISLTHTITYGFGVTLRVSSGKSGRPELHNINGKKVEMIIGTYKGLNLQLTPLYSISYSNLTNENNIKYKDIDPGIGPSLMVGKRIITIKPRKTWTYKECMDPLIISSKDTFTKRTKEDCDKIFEVEKLKNGVTQETKAFDSSAINDLMFADEKSFL